MSDQPPRASMTEPDPSTDPSTDPFPGLRPGRYRPVKPAEPGPKQTTVMAMAARRVSGLR